MFVNMINFKHLHYFWVVAKRGSITRASEQLHLTPQTISGQLSLLEDQLGDNLFLRVGRNLELTETGRMVLSYAEEIFSLGGELEEMVRNLPQTRQIVFTVGVADVVPKSIAHRLLAPALQMAEPVRIICKEGSVESLLADLALHKIDLLIADGPIPQNTNVRGYNHFLGSSGISFFAKKQLAKQLKDQFPASLNGAPLLIPGKSAVVSRRLAEWFEKRRLHPKIVGEFEDSALMKAFGRAGAGVFIAPTQIAKEVEEQYDVCAISDTNDVQDHFYAISVERKISHPAVAVITEKAKEWLVSNQTPAARNKKSRAKKTITPKIAEKLN